MMPQLCSHLGPARKRDLKRRTHRTERRLAKLSIAREDYDVLPSRRSFHGWGC